MAEETKNTTPAPEGDGEKDAASRRAAANRPQRTTLPRSNARAVVEHAGEALAERLETAETTDDLSMPELGVVFTPGYPAPPVPMRGGLRSDRPLIHMGNGRYQPDDVSTIADMERVAGEAPDWLKGEGK